MFGHSDLRNLPYTLAYVRQQGTYVPSWYRDMPEVKSGWKRSGAGWLVPSGVLWRSPYLACAGVRCCLPRWPAPACRSCSPCRARWS